MVRRPVRIRRVTVGRIAWLVDDDFQSKPEHTEVWTKELQTKPIGCVLIYAYGSSRISDCQ